MKGVAYDYLSPLQQAQLQHCLPNLKLLPHQCQRCYNGQVLYGSCLQCGAEYDDQGNLIEPALAVGMVGKGTHHGPRTPIKRKVR